MYRSSDPIGVFDSGLGGISVLRQLCKQMPHEDFVYFGDCVNAPYGLKPREEVISLTMTACESLLSSSIKALVVACNTATAAAIDLLRAKYPDRIIVGIEPALKLAVDRHPNGEIAVMATPLTLNQQKFKMLELQHSNHCTVHEIPVTGLVELVESGKADSLEATQLLQPLLDPIRAHLDAVVLGCTHYPFAAKSISKILLPRTELLDGGEGTARETMRRLADADLLNTSGSGTISFRFSGESQVPYQLADQLLHADIPDNL